MAIRRMTGPSSPDTLQRVILEDVEYQLRWRYVQIEDRWSLDLSSADGTLLAGGIRIVQSFALLAENRAGRGSDTFPPGEIIVTDLRTTGRVEPGLEELGTDLGLFYVDRATLEELAVP